MSSTIEQLEGLKRKLTITISKELVEEAFQSSLKKAAKSANIKGFRPGKAPLSVIEKKFGKNIRAEVAGNLMQSSFPEAVQEHQLRVAGMPEVHSQEISKEKAFIYEAIFEVYPDIQLKALDGEKIEKEVGDLDQKDIDDMLKQLRKQHATWKAVNRSSQNGDRLDINFEGFIDGKAFEGGKAEHFQLELGSKQMIAGFEDGLIGVNLNDELDLKVSFPDNYPVEDLAAKPAVFKVKINKIEAPELPDLDDEFAKKVGFENGLDELIKNISTNLQKELDHVISSKLKSNVLERLLKINEISVPDSLVDSEVEHLQQMTRQQMAAQQGSREIPDIKLAKEPFLKEAEKRVRLGLLLAEAIQVYNIKLDEDKVRDKINQIASAYKQPEEVVNWYRKNKQMMSEIETTVLEEQVVSKLLEKANINEIKKSYKEIMGLTQSKGEDNEQ